ncbi:hypothetical protein D910_12072 [Dendroctonus ponderosae]
MSRTRMMMMTSHNYCNSPPNTKQLSGQFAK